MTLQVPRSRPAMVPPAALTAVQFHTLAAIPPKLEWFAHLPHQSRTGTGRVGLAHQEGCRRGGKRVAAPSIRTHSREEQRLAHQKKPRQRGRPPAEFLAVLLAPPASTTSNA
jgi:hypothetical protein